VEFSGILLEMLGASFCNCAQTVIAFTFLSLVQAVTYSVANVTKRVVVIAASMLYFGSMGSWLNLFGIAISMSGVAM
jgi:solute carrier family 35 protein E1